MRKHIEALLAAERRGRALVLRHLPSSGDVWLVAAPPNRDGSALMAASRLACRLGAQVTVSLPDSAPDAPEWALLAESCRLQGLVWSGAPKDGPGLIVRAKNAERTVEDIPDSEAAWSVSLAASHPLVSLASPGSPVMSCAECRDVDRRAMDDFGVPGLCLMENAAMAAVAVARAMLPPAGHRAVGVVAGGGNNGGDGLAMARGFSALGIPVEVALLKPAASLSGDAGENYRLLSSRPEIAVRHLSDSPAALSAFLTDKALVVDALLGTGFRGGLSPVFKSAIEQINASGVPVLALDLPSGLDGDRGTAAETAVRASACVTFAAVKKGLTANDGPNYCGKLYLGDIGAPTAALLPKRA